MNCSARYASWNLPCRLSSINDHTVSCSTTSNYLGWTVIVSHATTRLLLLPKLHLMPETVQQDGSQRGMCRRYQTLQAATTTRFSAICSHLQNPRCHTSVASISWGQRARRYLGDFGLSPMFLVSNLERRGEHHQRYRTPSIAREDHG